MHAAIEVELPSPAGLPDGWTALERLSLVSGKPYKFFRNDKHGFVGNLKAVIEHDAKDRGADIGEALKQYDQFVLDKRAVPPEALEDFDPQDSGLGPELLAALPEDPKPGEAAWVKCCRKMNTDKAGNKTNLVVMLGAENFQVTLAGASGSAYAAYRIARACYSRFDAGDTKEQVLQFRKSCYSEFRAAIARFSEANPDSKSKNSKPQPAAGKLGHAVAANVCESGAGPGTATEAGGEHTGGDVENTRVGTKKRKKHSDIVGANVAENVASALSGESVLNGDRKHKCKQRKTDSVDVAEGLGGATCATCADGEADGIEEGGGKLNLDELLPQDAPPDSAAYHKVKAKKTTSCGHEYTSYGFRLKDISFHCSTKAARGNAEAAARIARLCYVRAEKGDSKDRVVEFRNFLCARLTGVAKENAEQFAKDIQVPQRDSKPISERNSGSQVLQSDSEAQKRESGSESDGEVDSSSSASSSSSTKQRNAILGQNLRAKQAPFHKPIPPKIGMVAAKMIVRSGMRSVLHISDRCADPSCVR